MTEYIDLHLISVVIYVPATIVVTNSDIASPAPIPRRFALPVAPRSEAIQRYLAQRYTLLPFDTAKPVPAYIGVIVARIRLSDQIVVFKRYIYGFTVVGTGPASLSTLR